jgi:hypothetical protein
MNVITRVWRAPEKKNNLLKREAYKQQLIDQLKTSGKCPKRPHEIKIRDLERMVNDEN